MGAADEAYAAAVAEIERVRAAGQSFLRLHGPQFAELPRLPGEVVLLKNLTRLSIYETQVSDLTPLSGLTSLRFLGLDANPIAEVGPLSGLFLLETLLLNHTKVGDLRPLQHLVALSTLGLDDTPVVDLEPLRGLLSLKALGLERTRVSDLRPIRELVNLGAAVEELITPGLSFEGTPFASASAETRRLAAIEDIDRRTRETLAFLKTLPPWPEPLPWEVAKVPEPEPLPPQPDPAVPLMVTPEGIALVAPPLSPGEVRDPVRPVLFDELRAAAEVLFRLGNRNEEARRVGEALRGLLAGGLEALKPLRLHIEIERLRRYAEDPVERIDPEVRRVMADVLELAPGLTLDTPEVNLWIDRRQRARLEVLDQERIEAEIRIARGIASTDLSTPDVRDLAALAASPTKDDQFTAIRPALARNYVLENGKILVGATVGAAFGHLVTTGHPGWLVAHAADILIAARGWGEPYLAWIVPTLDRAQQMVDAARHAGMIVRERSDPRG